jgi:hypothetical protein
MEGAYNKVYHARERLPREEYEVLIDTLLTTVRYAKLQRGTDKPGAKLPIR